MGLIEKALDSIGGRLSRRALGDSSEESAGSGDGVATDENRSPSDEERLLAVIRAANGRVWQATLCEEVDWSESKVSRQLARLEEEGEVSKYRVGRRNAICLTEHEPDPTHFQPEQPVDGSIPSRR